ncbi:hypothetical protein ACVOMV_33195 [Mesorhizobium atlanticum]
MLRLSLRASGGPPVRKPASTGYGTQLIQFAIAYNLGGNVEQNYRTEGFEAEIVVPSKGPLAQIDGRCKRPS